MSITRTKFTWFYLAMAFGIAWLFWLPVAITGRNYQSSPLLLLLVLAGVFGPGMAGILLTYVEKGKEGCRDFWQRMFEFRRIWLIWYLIIILLWPSLHFSAIFLSDLMGGDAPDYKFVKQTIAQPLNILIVIILYFIQAGLDELGWRSYLLEQLQGSMGLTKNSLTIGIFHTLRHLPIFCVVGTNQ